MGSEYLDKLVMTEIELEKLIYSNNMDNTDEKKVDYLLDRISNAKISNRDKVLLVANVTYEGVERVNDILNKYGYGGLYVKNYKDAIWYYVVYNNKTFRQVVEALKGLENNIISKS